MIGQARVGLSGWYVYPLLSTAVPGTPAAALTLAGSVGAYTEGTIPLYQNADFELHQVQFYDTQTTNPGQFSIKFGTPDVFFMPNWILVPTICGQGNLPHLLPQKILFPRGSFINVQLRNETANARTVYFAFEGINVNVTG